jgi:hypothetical protein
MSYRGSLRANWKALLDCIWEAAWRIGITPCPKAICCVTLSGILAKPRERTTVKITKALFIAALAALPLAAHAQTKQVLPKPALETNLSTAADDPSAKAKALEAQQEARHKAWEEKAHRLSRSICNGC